MTRTQIIRKTRSVINKANRIWRLNVPYPVITFYQRGTTAGWADSSLNTIRYNERISSLNPEEFKYIIIHEVAHLVCNKIFPNAKRPHGKEFKVIDLALGGKGFTKHDLKV